METVKIAVVKPINGIGLNGNEYLLNESDGIMLFETEQQAKDFLIGKGIDNFDSISFVEYKE